YQGKANWDCFEQLKKEINIPIIANGDITKPGQAKHLLEGKKCDGVMLGRGAQKNPLLAQQINSLCKQEKQSKILQREICLEYLKLAKKYATPFSMCQDHIAWFCSGIPEANTIKKTIRKTSSFDKLQKVCESL
ncbi:MAG: tRNA-dihydrouridine synthase, partial [Candidatus Nanoarchaeia archaeon]